MARLLLPRAGRDCRRGNFKQGAAFQMRVEYSAFYNMKSRCYKPNHKAYKTMVAAASGCAIGGFMVRTEKADSNASQQTWARNLRPDIRSIVTLTTTATTSPGTCGGRRGQNRLTTGGRAVPTANGAAWCCVVRYARRCAKPTALRLRSVAIGARRNSCWQPNAIKKEKRFIKSGAPGLVTRHPPPRAAAISK
jgi:hypothetical protein